MQEVEEKYQLLLDDKEALRQIRQKFNIEEGRFLKGLTYVGLTLDGTMSKTKAYATAFDAKAEEASKVSSQFHRAKWIQELLLYMRPEDNSLYLSEIKRIIGTNMAIINDKTATHREKIDATKALQPYIKAEKKIMEMNYSQADTTGQSLVAQLGAKIDLLVNAGYMVNEEGNIVDVGIIE